MIRNIITVGFIGLICLFWLLFEFFGKPYDEYISYIANDRVYYKYHFDETSESFTLNTPIESNKIQIVVRCGGKIQQDYNFDSSKEIKLTDDCGNLYVMVYQDSLYDSWGFDRIINLKGNKTVPSPLYSNKVSVGIQKALVTPLLNRYVNFRGFLKILEKKIDSECEYYYLKLIARSQSIKEIFKLVSGLHDLFLTYSYVCILIVLTFSFLFSSEMIAICTFLLLSLFTLSPVYLLTSALLLFKLQSSRLLRYIVLLLIFFSPVINLINQVLFLFSFVCFIFYRDEEVVSN